MINKNAVRLIGFSALVVAAVVGCSGSSGTPSGAPAKASAAASGSEKPAAVKPATTARNAARQFAQALARGDAGMACGLADPRLRALASSRGGSCPQALDELATDDRYVFGQTKCVNSSKNYQIDGNDPQDTAESLRVDIDCPEGYTWLRVNRVGDIWRVTDFNTH
ncbi:hypothetical protein ACIGW3_08220 [Streptomyces sp. NPDC053499]|uniref:hypothetical protein n=1 Tax=Streptomyces sp. NPDC053499 TaxID=3365707 RepID=UPI0037D4322C